MDTQCYYQQTAAEVQQKLSTPNGLSALQIEASRKTNGRNQLDEAKPVSLLNRILDSLKEPMLLLLLLAGALTLGVNTVRLVMGMHTEFVECVGIGLAVFLSVGIGVSMEYRSAKAFETLRRLGGKKKVRVIRDGIVEEIDAEALVVGDLVCLSEGERVAADGRLIQAIELTMDESALTGESMPVDKDAQAVLDVETPVAERITMVYTGTYVTHGTAQMIVTAVGMGTEFGKIARDLLATESSSTPLQEKLATLGKRITILGICTAGAILLLELILLMHDGIFTFIEVSEAFISAIVLIVAAVPEGLPTIVAVSLAINVMKLAKEQALVKKLIACETIGCVNVICSDKTGTLTENKMTVLAAVNANGKQLVTPEMLENMSLNVTAKGRQEADNTWAWMGNPTECALLDFAQRSGVPCVKHRDSVTILDVQPFSSLTKYMVSVVQVGEEQCSYMKGAPEVVLSQCQNVDLAKANADMLMWQEKACRVLAFAHRMGDGAWCYDGFAAIRDPLRADVYEAVKRCKSAGIELKILTGDNRITASAIAQELGQLDGARRVLEAHEVESLSDSELSKLLPEVAVIARSTPSIKRRVVSLLKAQGAVVALTGDGINDAPAIQMADVGIAMGITGTDVTKAACSILLLDDAFSTIVRAVQWGRGIYENFQRFILFQLTVNLASMLVVLFTVIMSTKPPFSALELLWINLIMDGPPALTLGLEPIRQSLLRRKPIQRNASIVTRPMIIRILCIGLYVTAVVLAQHMFNFLGAQECEVSSALFTLFVFFQLFNAFNARELGDRPLIYNLFGNPTMLISFAVTFALQWVVTEYGGSIFNTAPLSLTLWIKILLCSLTVIPVSELCRWIMRKMH